MQQRPLNLFLLLVLFLVSGQQIKAQLISGEAFLKGDFIEVGMNSCGAFGTSSGAPAGFGVSGQRLGFVADVDMDGFDVRGPSGYNFFGDFFLPGSHVEGWAINFNGVNYFNGNGCGGSQVPGSVTSSSSPGNATQTAVWEGAIAGVDISRSVSFPRGEKYFVIDVEICNNSPSTINNVFFSNNVDPDNAQRQCRDFSTTNTIVSQPSGSTCEALVTATSAPCGEPEAFLGLAAADERARVTYGGFNNTNAASIYNCSFGGCVSTVGSSNNADQGNSLAFSLGNIASGDCVTFSYAYVLSEDVVDDALTAVGASVILNGPLRFQAALAA